MRRLGSIATREEETTRTDCLDSRRMAIFSRMLRPTARRTPGDIERRLQKAATDEPLLPAGDSSIATRPPRGDGMRRQQPPRAAGACTEMGSWPGCRSGPTTPAAKLSRGQHGATAHGAAAAALRRWKARARSAAAVTPTKLRLKEALQRRGNRSPRVNFTLGRHSRAAHFDDDQRNKRFLLIVLQISQRRGQGQLNWFWQIDAHWKAIGCSGFHEVRIVCFNNV